MVSKSQNLLISEQKDSRPSFSPSSNPSHKFTDDASNPGTHQQLSSPYLLSRDTSSMGLSKDSRMSNNAMTRTQLTLLILSSEQTLKYDFINQFAT